MKGYLQVYTGKGRGKTTASMGLALRAAGAGFNVYIAQFLKKDDSSESRALERFDNITIEQFGSGELVDDVPSEKEKTRARAGYEKLVQVLTDARHDLVIVEEGNVAVSCGLFSEKELLAMLDMKPENVEMVITGRGAKPSLLERADLVTEMKEIKHYIHQGVEAR
jgi:cob(I)alamin adenosyltransferase